MSVENRKHGLPRIDHLRDAPARVRFLSVEPLLEDLGRVDLTGISWVIVGGESGPGARPMEERWVLSLRDQCAEAQIPFFFKQWGGTRKGKTGRLLQGRTHDDQPPRIEPLVPGRKERLAAMDEIAALAAPFRPPLTESEREFLRRVEAIRDQELIGLFSDPLFTGLRENHGKSPTEPPDGSEAGSIGAGP